VTWTFHESRDRDLDLVRLALGDTDTTAQVLSDEYIDGALSLYVTVAATVTKLASELVARYGREPVRVTVDELTVDYSERLSTWRALISGGSGGVVVSPITYPPIRATEDVPSGWIVR
jgi:hypothetical protein